MLLRIFKIFFAVSATWVLLSLIAGCATVGPPPMETCTVDPADSTLVCTTHGGTTIVRPLSQASDYVCFPGYDLKMWIEYCHK